MSQTVREIAADILAGFSAGSRTKARERVRQLATHVLASPEPLSSERLREIESSLMDGGAPQLVREIRRLQTENADLRAQLQAAQRERDDWVLEVERLRHYRATPCPDYTAPEVQK